MEQIIWIHNQVFLILRSSELTKSSKNVIQFAWKNDFHITLQEHIYHIIQVHLPTS